MEGRKVLTLLCTRADLATSQSYIYPPTFRTKIAEVWGTPEAELQKWWLPNEEGLLPIVKSLRDFVQERTSPKTTNQTSEDVKNMKAMFSKLTVDDSPRDSPEGSGSAFNDSGLFSGSEMSGTPRITEQEIFTRVHPGNPNRGFSSMRSNDMVLGLDAMGQQFVDEQGAALWLEPTDPNSAISWSTQTGFYQPPRQ